MDLTHINLENLTPAKANVRKVGVKDIADLKASIAALGLLQPLLVRPNGNGFEIIAGQRRYHALCALAEDGETDPVPCIIMEEGDDTAAIEASLAENLIRMPMDEIDQYKAFAALVKKGMGSANIAAHFAVSEQLMNKRLAIANLLAPILTLYGKDDISPATVQILTMATKAQQKDWLALHKDDPRSAPQGSRLKSWLFGGEQITTEAALFDLADYPSNIVSDLFGEDSYFDDPELFWTHQNAAISALKSELEAEGWSVEVMDTGERFQSWNYVDTSKEDGGMVFIQVSHNGEVTVFKGQLSRDAIKKRDQQDAPPKPKSELTKPMQNYLALRRHAAVRHELAGSPGLSLRVMVAQLIAGSEHVQACAEPQKAKSEAIAESLKHNTAEAAFAEQRTAVAALLGLDAEAETAVPRAEDWDITYDFEAILATLCALDDAAVMQVLAVVTAETLSANGTETDIIGAKLGTDMRDHWTPDQTFFDLMRSKPAINAMVAELAGHTASAEHITSTAKVQKSILQACLDGTRTPKIENWQPRYMSFPMGSYVDAPEAEETHAEAA